MGYPLPSVNVRVHQFQQEDKTTASITLHTPWRSLPKVESTKYLGVKLSKDPRWNQLVEITLNKLTSTLSFITKTVAAQARELRSKAYQQLCWSTRGVYTTH